MVELTLTQALDTIPEILPTDRLAVVQTLAERGELTTVALTEQLGKIAVVLLGLGVAAALDDGIARRASPAIGGKIRNLSRYITTQAPALLSNPRVRVLAEKVSSVLEIPAAEPQPQDPASMPPFEDISSIRCIPMFLGFENQLVPIVRAEIAGREKEPLLDESLRLSDLAFLSSSLVAALANAVDLVYLVAGKGLLQEGELQGVEQRIDEITRNLSLLKEKLVAVERAQNAQSAPAGKRPARK